MIEAELPDGRILEFPDGTDPDVIQRTVKGVLGVQEPEALGVQEATEQPQLDTLNQLRKRAESFDEFKQFREEGGIAGMMGMKPALEQEPEDIAMGFAGPGAIRSVGAVARQAPRLLQNLFKKPVPKAPTMEELKTLSGEAYDVADQAGLVVKQQSFAKAVQDLGQELTEAGAHPRLHPKAMTAFKELADNAAAGDLPLRQFEILRRISKSAKASNEVDERRIGGIIVDRLDDYLEGIGQADVVAGDASLASKALTRARSLWTRAKKTETIEELIERAQERAPNFSQSGLENALRNEFKTFALNRKKMRLFTKPEQAAIRRVNRGGPGVKALRLAGKFAPTGVISIAAGSGLGALAGGPAGAVALPIVGLGARQAATALTQKNARLASELMRRGAPPPSATPQSRAPVSRGQGLIFGDIPGIDPLEQRRR